MTIKRSTELCDPHFPHNYQLLVSFLMDQQHNYVSVFSVLGKIRSAIGSAQLLMSQKFLQFRELCEENLVSEFKMQTHMVTFMSTPSQNATD